VDGRIVPPGTEPPLEMFADSARGTVRFADGVAALLDRFPGALAVEAGPGHALSGMVTSTGMDAVPLSEPALSLAALWVRGQPVDLAPLAPAARRLHLPVTTFGGDRHVAPETSVAPPTPAAPVAEDAAPTVEAEVEDAWRSLLGRPGLTQESDFFACGGDSLLAVRLLRRLEQTFAVEIPLRDLILTRTLGGQVRLVQRILEGCR
jgi:acyl transferase domain-containing protein